MKQAILSFLLAAAIVSFEQAFAMSSTNYEIPSDVIGSSGAPSESATYELNDTLGEMATGPSSSSTYDLKAGFWQTAEGYVIAINCDSFLNMEAISGTGRSDPDMSSNFATCNIFTDDNSGYNLYWKASAATMASGGDSIAAYTPAVSEIAELWSVASSASEWGGHLGSGSDTVNTTFWGSADSYAAGKWLNIPIADFNIATRLSKTAVAGDDEYIYFGAEVGADKFQPSGTHSVTVTFTSVAR
jgi:hypothetical protein